MKDSLTQAHEWTKKIHVSKEGALIAGVLIAGTVAYFKVRPMFDPKIQVRAYDGKEKSKKESQSNASHGKAGQPSGDNKPRELTPIERLIGPFGRRRGRGGADTPPGRTNAARVIERPLFDGLTIVVQAELLGDVSSLQSDNTVEAQIVAIVSKASGIEIDTVPAENATLAGAFTPNFDQKRLQFSFRELLSQEGRRYPIAGIAIDPETHSLGAIAHYSSGLPSRLLGATLSRVLMAADTIGMMKVFENVSDPSPAGKEVETVGMESNQQAANDLSQVATQGLRETKAELKLPAGTILTLRIKPIIQNPEGTIR